MPTQTKKEIYKIACYFNILILEDDPYYLLTFDGSVRTQTLTEIILVPRIFKQCYQLNSIL